METWKDRKRPWEEDDLVDAQLKRRGSTSTASAFVARHPSPPPGGYYSRTSDIPDGRRLPPLYTQSSATSATSAIPHHLQTASTGEEAKLSDESRRTGPSLFYAHHYSHRQTPQGSIERPGDYSRVLEREESPQPSVTEVHQPRIGLVPLQPAAEDNICCPPNCRGQACSSTRALIHKFATDLTSLDARVRSLHQTEDPSQPIPLPIERLSILTTFQWALEVVQWTNRNLKEHIEQRTIGNSDIQRHLSDQASMRRSQQHLEEREERSPSHRQYSSTSHVYPPLNPHTGVTQDDIRRTFHGNEGNTVASSPNQTASSIGSAFVNPQSPMQASQPLRTSILPSPSSLNFPNPSITHLPSLSPPNTAGHTAAQSVHLQDLQHQISVKTLAFQTLQREYDSLLQKLERQRTKCAALEKKFEVSDVEINSLTDEKERLQGQVAVLETQMEDLQENRDEARRQLVANGAQYMRIMEMANKLQAQGAEDRKKWDQEKIELEQRIRTLEEAMMTGTDTMPPDVDQGSGSPSLPSIILTHGSSSASQVETINILRAEVARLRSRTQTLENALKAMKHECISIQAAAQQLVESSGRLEVAAKDV